MIQNLGKIVLEIAIFLLSFVLSFFLRFPREEAIMELTYAARLIPIFILMRVGSFELFKLHSSIWRYSGMEDLSNIIKGATLGTFGMVITIYFLRQTSVPRSIFMLDWLLVVFLTGGMRMAIRQFYETFLHYRPAGDFSRNVLVYGGGRAGELLLRNIKSNPAAGINVVGIIDDDPLKKGRYIHNIQILGDGSMIRSLVQKYAVNEIYFSISALSGLETRRMLKTIREQTGDDVEIQTIPGLRDLVDGRVTINQLRRIELRDLLRRLPVHLDYTPVKRMVGGSKVLVVGGGGSIGSELCRQIGSFDPEILIVLDNSEYNLYHAEGTLREQYPGLRLECVVADACSEEMMRKIFALYSPDHVFHAAAYKHVPMMEMNPAAAIYNNLMSTLVLARCAGEFKAGRFVLISTDKAVQPTNVMGATKRVNEQVVMLFGKDSASKFLTVRFGNVLGSSGSVIPKFQRQIEQGGPITVTDPEVTRYFMLISEAVELVLQAGAIGEGGEIYVLDMGPPIRIIDLARYMVELSGLKLNEDIKINFTGLRPGEKLHESLYHDGEEKNTDIPGLLMLKPKVRIDGGYLSEVEKLIAETNGLEPSELRARLKELVPEYEFEEQESLVD